MTCGWREEKQSHYLTNYYVQAVYQAGGIPILLPTLPPDTVEETYSRMDGFLFSGGDDLDPYFFGEEPRNGLGEVTPNRDIFELALAQRALQGEKPVFAICRGLQIINVAAGGTIHQDISGITQQVHFQNAPRWYPFHQVELEEHSRLYWVLKQKKFRVNSFHHQAICKLGENLSAVGWSKDGIIEAIEYAHPSKHIYGVQWHPECSWDKDEISFKLFKNLVE